MNIDGWNFDHALFADPPSVNVTQRLFESPTGRFAAVAYHVNEYRMGTEIARLAVFENKAFPRLVFKQPEIWWLANLVPPAAAWIAEAAFVAVTAGRSEMPLVVVDLDRQRFCFIHIPRGDCYRARVCDGFVVLSAERGEDASWNGWRRPYAELPWIGFDRLADFFVAYEESADFHGVPKRSKLRRVWEALFPVTRGKRTP